MGHAFLLAPYEVMAHRDIDLTKDVYHIIKFKYFKKLINSKTIRLSKVTSWSDTFEYPMRAIVDGRKETVSKNLYGFCMTKNFDIESLWKLHGMIDGKFDNKTICIKINPTLFCKSIYKGFEKLHPEMNGFNYFPFFNIFLAPVKYLDLKVEEMHKMFETDDRFLYPDFLYPAFLKRKNYEVESEVRLIFFNTNHSVDNKESIFIPLGNLDFISEIIINPFITGKELAAFEKELNKVLGSSISISKSNLLELISSEVELLYDELKYWGQAKDAQVIVSKYKANSE